MTQIAIVTSPSPPVMHSTAFEGIYFFKSKKFFLSVLTQKIRYLKTVSNSKKILPSSIPTDMKYLSQVRQKCPIINAPIRQLSQVRQKCPIINAPIRQLSQVKQKCPIITVHNTTKKL